MLLSRASATKDKDTPRFPNWDGFPIWEAPGTDDLNPLR